MSWFRRNRSGAVLDLRAAKPVRRQAPRRLSRRALLIAAISIAALAVVGLGAWWFASKQASVGGKSAMQVAVMRVGKLMLLPAGEDPTYGTVTDKSKLASQTFFARAENGDEVLIYEKARINILYRPSVNKIVNVGPLVVGKQGSPYVTSRIAILNGSGNADLLDKMTAAVTAAFPNASIVSKGPASRSYPTTIIADLTGHSQPLTEQVADTLGVQGGKTPLGDPAPSADLVVIIGQDYH